MLKCCGPEGQAGEDDHVTHLHQQPMLLWRSCSCWTTSRWLDRGDWGGPPLPCCTFNYITTRRTNNPLLCRCSQVFKRQKFSWIHHRWVQIVASRSVVMLQQPKKLCFIGASPVVIYEDIMIETTSVVVLILVLEVPKLIRSTNSYCRFAFVCGNGGKHLQKCLCSLIAR